MQVIKVLFNLQIITFLLDLLPKSPGSPTNGADKSKKNFYARLNKVIEDNMYLKIQQ